MTAKISSLVKYNFKLPLFRFMSLEGCLRPYLPCEFDFASSATKNSSET